MKNKIFLILACVLFIIFQSKELMAGQEITTKKTENTLASPDVEIEKSSYIAKEGATLKGVLIEWSARNDYGVEWNVMAPNGDEIDWEIKRIVVSKKDFYSSVSELLTAYKNSPLKIKFIWNFYRGNRMLIIGLGDIK